MAKFKESCIITDMQKNVKLAWGGGATLEDYIPGRNRNFEHVFYIDEKNGIGDLYSECVWFMSDDMVDPEYKKRMDEMMEKLAAQMKDMSPEDMPGPKPHSHPFDEIFAFFGTNFDNPDDLCADIDFYLEDEPVKITKSGMFYIPAGMKHSPVNFNRMDKSIFHFSMGFTDSYYHDVLIDKGGKYEGQTGMSKYLIKGYGDKRTQLPYYRKDTPEGFTYWLTQLNCEILPESGMHSETCWIYPEHKTGIKGDVTFVDEHSHPFQQVIVFCGSDLTDIHKLHAEVEFWVQGKPYKMKKSFCAVIPEGVEHGPLMVRNVTKPIFHYTVGNAKKYE